VFTPRLQAENHPVIASCDDDSVTVGSKSLVPAVTAALGLAVAGPALADSPHGNSGKGSATTVVHPTSGSQAVQGVVQSVSTSVVFVRQLDGSPLSVPVDRKTKITVNGRSAKISDVRAGYVLVATLKAGEPAAILRFVRPS
jgi:hypothetical protein